MKINLGKYFLFFTIPLLFFIGHPGEIGPMGIKGHEGEKGDKCERGDRGPEGQKGEPVIWLILFDSF